MTLRTLALCLLLTPLLHAQDKLPTPAAFEQPAEVTFWTSTGKPFGGDSLVAALQEDYPKLTIHWRAVPPPELLYALTHGGHPPDILYLENAYQKKFLMDQHYRLVIGNPGWSDPGRGWWLLPVDAPDPKLSEAFTLWLEKRGPRPTTELLTKEDKQTITDSALAAVRALGYTLKAPADAGLDPAIASFDWGFLSTRLTGPSGAEQQVFTPEVRGITGNDRLAFAYVTAFAQGDDFYGLRRFFLILRHQETSWRVLSILPDSPTGSRVELSAETLGLKNGEQPSGTLLLPITPIDTVRVARRPYPEITFQEEGAPGVLLAIESQTFDALRVLWAPPTLVFTGPSEGRHILKVNAPDAPNRGPYRWRVWSIAKTGEVTLTPWRTNEIF